MAGVPHTFSLQNALGISASERGAVLVFFTGILGILLLIIGLAIDVGNLYRAEVSLQKAVDAAALSGLSYSVKRGKFAIDRELRAKYGDFQDRQERDEFLSNYLNEKVTELLRSTMALNGLPHSVGTNYEIDVDSVYEGIDPTLTTDVAATYSVSASRRLDFFLIDLVPGFGAASFQQLTANATVERKVANVVVLLDVSDSMNCPATGDCSCMQDPLNARPCDRPTKMDKLIDSLKVFMRLFDPARDKLYIVPFNVRGTVIKLEEYSRGVLGLQDLDELTEAQLDALIEQVRTSFAPKGSTNFCDAMMRTIGVLNDDGVFGNRDVQYVLFSDGAPTAGRWLFNNPKPALPQWNQGAGDYDYTVYSVEWRAASDPQNFLIGPSPLIQTDLLDMDMSNPEPPAGGSGTDDDGNPSAAIWAECSRFNANEALTPVVAANQVQGVATSVLASCLYDMSAKVPLSNTVYGTNYDNTTRQLEHWREQYYNCAIMLSDLMRQNKGRVHFIASGPAAPLDPNSPDPYQNVGDVTQVHHVFNARIAGDSLEAIGVRPNNPYPEFTFDGYERYENIESLSAHGTYLYAPDASKLEKLFEEIGHQILIRLTE